MRKDMCVPPIQSVHGFHFAATHVGRGGGGGGGGDLDPPLQASESKNQF